MYETTGSDSSAWSPALDGADVVAWSETKAVVGVTIVEATAVVVEATAVVIESTAVVIESTAVVVKATDVLRCSASDTS
jgi:hypothetical protein|tara:strand:+ start:292 stop:528 length:237 start_codon:yes stop_codon:yes gene_type:complete